MSKHAYVRFYRISAPALQATSRKVDQLIAAASVPVHSGVGIVLDAKADRGCKEYTCSKACCRAYCKAYVDLSEIARRMREKFNCVGIGDYYFQIFRGPFKKGETAATVGKRAREARDFAVTEFQRCGYEVNYTDDYGSTVTVEPKSAVEKTKTRGTKLPAMRQVLLVDWHAIADVRGKGDGKTLCGETFEGVEGSRLRKQDFTKLECIECMRKAVTK